MSAAVIIGVVGPAVVVVVGAEARRGAAAGAGEEGRMRGQ